MAKKLYTPEEVSKKFETLPKEVANLLYSFEMTSIITKIGEKHGLHIDQMDSLNTETTYVMMGLTAPQEFSSILTEDLNIDQEKANSIVSDINDLLFSKVRTAMNQPSAVAASTSSPTTNPTSAPVRQPLSQVLTKESISIPVQTAPVAPVAAPVIPPAPVAPAPTAPITPLPAIPKVDMHPADVALTQKTVATPAPAASATAAATPKPIADAKMPPPKPTDYKADPYREPIS